MKLYTSITLDWDGDILNCEAEEYFGPLDLCKGGGTTTTTTTTSEPDREYNARLAAVAERQQSMSDQYYDWWKTYQAPVEQQALASQSELLPLQTQVSKEGLLGLQGVQQDFYQAVKPKSSTLAAGQAATDVNRALSTAQGTLQRDMARMGVDPSSGAATFGMRDLALQGVAAKAGAANLARKQTEDMNLQKLATGMQFGQN